MNELIKNIPVVALRGMTLLPSMIISGNTGSWKEGSS